MVEVLTPPILALRTSRREAAWEIEFVFLGPPVPLVVVGETGVELDWVEADED